MTIAPSAPHVPAWALRMPHAEPGMAVGLFGGSFNPAHSGHRLVADVALRRLGLDQIWWMVTPGNPMKDHGGLAPLADRIAQVVEIANHPRMRVTALEARLGSVYSAHTIARLLYRRPRLRFVWVMGADNLAGFHHWRDWRGILSKMPVAIVDRPGATLSSLSAPAARSFARYRLAERDAGRLSVSTPPAWVFLYPPRDPASSTALRTGDAGRERQTS